MNVSTCRNSDGFTLVEVLSALLIAVFVILTVTNLFIFAMHQVSLAREDTGAALFAEEKIEQLMQFSRGASELTAGQYVDYPAADCRRDWWIYDDQPAPGAKLFVVRVTPKQGNASRSVVFAGVRAR